MRELKISIYYYDPFRNKLISMINKGLYVCMGLIFIFLVGLLLHLYLYGVDLPLLFMIIIFMSTMLVSLGGDFLNRRINPYVNLEWEELSKQELEEMHEYVETYLHDNLKKVWEHAKNQKILDECMRSSHDGF